MWIWKGGCVDGAGRQGPGGGTVRQECRAAGLDRAVRAAVRSVYNSGIKCG
uniref:Uncharacterized protein n=1 Tax=Siphoviridae sp. ctBLh2 TaxID=2827803 RepID=A0A8S5S352_9CAUD|nr:MAG TPA: hypothetical protein [Siphoviridae sp. ctBLh2]